MRSRVEQGSLGRMASGGKQLPEARRKRPPASTPVTPTASLQRQALGLSLVLALTSMLMGQLSKCLVVQHGLSSFLVSSALQLGLSSHWQATDQSRVLPSGSMVSMDICTPDDGR